MQLGSSISDLSIEIITEYICPYLDCDSIGRLSLVSKALNNILCDHYIGSCSGIISGNVLLGLTSIESGSIRLCRRSIKESISYTGCDGSCICSRWLKDTDIVWRGPDTSNILCVCSTNQPPTSAEKDDTLETPQSSGIRVASRLKAWLKKAKSNTALESDFSIHDIDENIKSKDFIPYGSLDDLCTQCGLPNCHLDKGQLSLLAQIKLDSSRQILWLKSQENIIKPVNECIPNAARFPTADHGTNERTNANLSENDHNNLNPGDRHHLERCTHSQAPVPQTSKPHWNTEDTPTVTPSNADDTELGHNLPTETCSENCHFVDILNPSMLSRTYVKQHRQNFRDPGAPNASNNYHPQIHPNTEAAATLCIVENHLLQILWDIFNNSSIAYFQGADYLVAGALRYYRCPIAAYMTVSKALSRCNLGQFFANNHRNSVTHSLDVFMTVYRSMMGIRSIDRSSDKNKDKTSSIIRGAADANDVEILCRLFGKSFYTGGLYFLPSCVHGICLHLINAIGVWSAYVVSLAHYKTIISLVNTLTVGDAAISSSDFDLSANSTVYIHEISLIWNRVMYNDRKSIDDVHEIVLREYAERCKFHLNWILHKLTIKIRNQAVYDVLRNEFISLGHLAFSKTDHNGHVGHHIDSDNPNTPDYRHDRPQTNTAQPQRNCQNNRFLDISTGNDVMILARRSRKKKGELSEVEGEGISSLTGFLVHYISNDLDANLVENYRRKNKVASSLTVDLNHLLMIVNLEILTKLRVGDDNSSIYVWIRYLTDHRYYDSIDEQRLTRRLCISAYMDECNSIRDRITTRKSTDVGRTNELKIRARCNKLLNALSAGQQRAATDGGKGNLMIVPMAPFLNIMAMLWGQKPRKPLLSRLYKELTSSTMIGPSTNNVLGWKGNKIRLVDYFLHSICVYPDTSVLLSDAFEIEMPQLGPQLCGLFCQSFSRKSDKRSNAI